MAGCAGGGARVQSFAPNAFGLYDMAGSVWEWVADAYDAYYFRSSPGADPKGPSSGLFRVMKGGSWSVRAEYLRVSVRFPSSPDVRGVATGVRCARDVTQ